jgi:hypothetical protein
VRTIDRNGQGLWLASIPLLWLLSACGGQNGSQVPTDRTQENATHISVPEPVMLFDTLEHDFGTIIEGEKVVCYFDYANGGGADLLITLVEASCGCTSPGWSSEPLKPGERESLELIFDASGRSGVQRKLVTVRSNASKELVQLTIKANIINGV